jgi:2,5-diamino-6-(ribosylamino)-4(3H)-pyrimidinone 5'-phosphate reductase
LTLPVTTLFMLMSLDGKISTGTSEERDFDKDLPNLRGVAEGLGQYYRLEETTDRFSLNTGRVLAKVGWNTTKTDIERLPVSFVVVDNTHLTGRGIRNLLERTQRLIVVTANRRHPAVHVADLKLDVLEVEGHIDFGRLFGQLADMGVQDLTVQSGGTLNAALVRSNLINYVSVVVAPLLVGGRSTPTLLDGEPLDGDDDLRLLRPLELLSVRELDHSYLHLRYAVARRAT